MNIGRARACHTYIRNELCSFPKYVMKKRRFSPFEELTFIALDDII